MKQFLIVTSIIILISFPFLYPSIENAQDESFNDYEYLQKLRRTRSDINTDDKDKGWQEDETFKSWYQKGNGSEDDKALNNIKTSSSDILVPSNTVPSTISVVPTNTPSKSSSSSDEITKETKPGLNIVPYLLLVLLLMIIILAVYIKYNYV
jgi:hypothetical protein